MSTSAVASGGQPFAERACFIAGPAKSGTTLLTSLLDGHPDLLVLPEETAYFATVLTKYGRRSRREQVDYLTRTSLASVMFGAPPRRELGDYSRFPTHKLLENFEAAAFDPANGGRDLLVILMETYAALLGRSTDMVRWWVEKTPANRDYLPGIFAKFSHARVLMTLRDPRALLATQIQLEQNRRRRRFSIYLAIHHWRTAARVAIQQQSAARDPRVRVVEFQQLVESPEEEMRKVCAFLDIAFYSSTILPTKVGEHWSGNSAAPQVFNTVSTEPVNRWKGTLTQDEIGWVEWHCRELMEPLGYEPVLPRKQLRHWINPVREETPKEYLKSRSLSLRRWKRT